jgi:hypothetical protein
MVTPSKRTLDESSWGKCQRSPLRKQHDEREEQRRLPEPSECHEEGEQNGKHEEQATQEEGQERKRKHRDKPKKDHKVKGEGREEERKGGGNLPRLPTGHRPWADQWYQSAACELPKEKREPSKRTSRTPRTEKSKSKSKTVTRDQETTSAKSQD